MKRLIPLLSVLIALPAAADIVSGDAQPVSFVSSTDSLRVASTSPQWQLQTPAELDETAMPEVSVQSPRYQLTGRRGSELPGCGFDSSRDRAGDLTIFTRRVSTRARRLWRRSFPTIVQEGFSGFER